MRSNTRLRILVWCCLAAVLTPGLALAQTQLDGQTTSGAYFSIVVPDGWAPTDGLVIWNHGFDLSPPGPNPDLGPLAGLQLQEGYAVAASSYSLGGWALFNTLVDNRQLVEAFETNFGVPGEVFVTGASLGGIVTAQAIERGNLGNVVGAMPICGALAGSRLWDGGLDLRLIYDFVCEDVPGAHIPGGATGLPFPPDPNFDQNALGQAVDVCTGVLQPPNTRTAEQAQRLATILGTTALPENFLLTTMGFATFGLADLIFDPDKLGGGQGIGNANVDYGDPAINAGIERVGRQPHAGFRLLNNFTPRHYSGNAKIVSIHTDKDGLVLVENENEYASVVPPSQLTVGIVVEDVPSHCGFTNGEVVAAWESLRGWVAGLPQPDVQTLQGTCDALVAGGLAEGPCRYDPGFVVPNLDGRVKPRGACVAGGRTLCLGENDQFQVQMRWRGRDGNMRFAQALNGGGDISGSFFFFNPDNIELVVKALDGRQVNRHWWVFFGSLTDVEFELTVTDTETNLQKVYSNPAGTFASVGDTEAF